MNVFWIEGRDVGELPQVRDFRRGCKQMQADIAGADRISGVVTGCAFRVINGPGAGSAETVFESALAHELGEAGLAVLSQQAIAVHDDSIDVREYATGLHVCLLPKFGRARVKARRIVRDLSASTQHRRASAYIRG